MSFLNIFDNVGRIEIGLLLFGSNLDPFLCKGITDAVLKESGNTPSEIHLFMINVIGVTILSPHILRIFGPMPSKPVDLFG